MAEIHEYPHGTADSEVTGWSPRSLGTGMRWPGSWRATMPDRLRAGLQPV